MHRCAHQRARHGVIAAIAVCGLTMAACKQDDGRPPDGDPQFEPVAAPSDMELRLDALVYADGDAITVTLNFGDVPVPNDVLDVILGSPETQDVEVLSLVRVAEGIYVSETAITVRAAGPTVDPDDGVLSAQPNEILIAAYYVDREDPAFAKVEEDIVADFGLFEDDPSNYAFVEVEPELALTDDERQPPPGSKPVGTVLPRDGLPVQIATEELILYPTDEVELESFLEEAQGEVVDSQPVANEDGQPTGRTAYLVRVDPSTVDTTHFRQLRGFVGDESDLLVSNEGAARIYQLALHYRLEGYVVAVNPRLQYFGAPTTSPSESGAVTHTMKMVGPDATRTCLPGDADNPCVENVPATWVLQALWDQDDVQVNVGVLDIGFAPNDDFRRPLAGPWRECDASEGFDCGPGKALGPPTVGNSFFGDKSWHGTGVITTLGGIVNNGTGSSGVGGQVAVPMMYKYDLGSYIFEIGAGIVRATDDGASCINISGGYPCNILTTIGPTFNICTVEGRGEICLAVSTALVAVTGAVCGVGAFIPIIGPIACGVAVAATGFSIGACVASLTFGDLAGPMHTGVRIARREGVPVVASAGNKLSPDKLPGVIEDFVDLDDISIDRWQMVPAVVPGVIAVGAVGVDMRNIHFVGDAVAIWAPITSAYFAPESTEDPMSPLMRNTIGGTSAAAPFITGLVASMQAMNPALDPHGIGTTDDDRPSIVDEIREILTSDAATWSNAELVDLGFADEPARRLVVNPLAALQEAASRRTNAPYFDFESNGFDGTLNFSELVTPDEGQENAIELSPGVPATGTIAVIPGEGPFTPPPDVDWYRYSTPDAENPNRSFITDITIDFPQDPAGDQVFIPAGTPSVKLVSRGTNLVYKSLRAPNDSLTFRLTSLGDNVYRVGISEPELAVPGVQIVEPRPDDTICADLLTGFQVVATYPDFPEIDVGFDLPTNQVAWREDDIVGVGNTTSIRLAPGPHTITVDVFGDPSISDAITVEAVECAGSPPNAEIDSPPPRTFVGCGALPDLIVDADQGDANGAFHELELLATASDPDPGDILTLEWTTDRADIQPGGPTSGEQLLGSTEDLTVHVYSSCSVDFGTSDHRIVFRVTDSQGNSVSDCRFVRVLLLC